MIETLPQLLNPDARFASPTVWDAFDTPGLSDVILAFNPNGECNVWKCQNANAADDDYVKYAYSAALTSSYGFTAARISVSMPRVMTFTYTAENKNLMWTANAAGIAHYKKVIASYRQRDVKIALTMWHWDLPLAIEEAAAASASSECRGTSAWLCFDLVSRAFAQYAKLLLEHFGADVTWWITLNEPRTVIGNGYAGSGVHAPGRCSDRKKCFAGDDHVEPYLAAKGLILAHARMFRAWEAAGKPGAGCGLALNGDVSLRIITQPLELMLTRPNTRGSLRSVNRRVFPWTRRTPRT